MDPSLGGWWKEHFKTTVDHQRGSDFRMRG